MKRKIKASAPGKIILSGEHAVVYGYPALLVAIDRRVSIEVSGVLKRDNVLGELACYHLDKVISLMSNKFELVIDSALPIGCGLGSSAALSVALAGSFLKLSGEKWSLKEINQVAYEMEKRHHGNPSGGDNTIATYGGFLWYRKEAEGLKLFEKLEIKRDLPEFVLINTGKPKESTREMVGRVGKDYQRNKKQIGDILRKIEEATRGFLRFLLREENIVLSDLLMQNERLLEKLGVVSKSTMQLIRQIEKVGGAAKITGGGGREVASGALLAYHKEPKKLLDLAKARKLEAFFVKLGGEGVKVERKD